mmetsp:Transcript_18214/g.38001  ORF Transcript_18214/g.38001 Transcript_18214/m.38001 type:complete len:87 (-) Transcript_18214:19-279(-)
MKTSIRLRDFPIGTADQRDLSRAGNECMFILETRTSNPNWIPYFLNAQCGTESSQVSLLSLFRLDFLSERIIRHVLNTVNVSYPAR